MARKSQSPKRGRAELAIASDASQQPDEAPEADGEQETNRPRGRGRPRKSLEGNPPEFTDAPDSPARKRGRPSMGIMAAKAAAAADQPKRKRGRPSLGGEKASTDGAEAAEQPKRKRGRPSLGGEKAQKNGAAAGENDEEEPPSASKRGRPRNEVEQRAEEDYVDDPRPAKRKRGRPSLKDQLPSETQEGEAAAPDGKKKRGRKPLRDRTSWGEKWQQADEGPEEGEGEEHDNVPDEDDEEEEEQEDEEEEDQEEEDPDEEPKNSRRKSSSTRKPYPHVVARVRGIKQSTIDAKWSPLTASSIAAATETLTLAHRPIMQRLANTQQRRQHTASALSLLHRRVSRKLKRGLPFPPPAVAATSAPKTSRRQARGGRRGGGGGHEAELDFESVLDGARALERQLDPALHSLELLKKEKERMKKELEKDYQTLRHLEAGARMQAREQRDQLKKTHALVPDDITLRKGKVRDAEIKFEVNGAVAPGTVFKDFEDGEMKELALQLGGHVYSMRTNLKQVDGLVPQIAKSRAALQNVLLKHLSQGQYEEVILGQ